MLADFFYLEIEMIKFTAIIKKFDQQGEKTGWTYIDVPAAIANEIYPDQKKSFRVKGTLDAHKIKQVALVPIGSGDFIMALKADLRKALGKRKGAMLEVQIMLDKEPYKLNTALMECLADEPAALDFFLGKPLSHQHYYSKWIESAKTEATRAKRIAMAVSSLANKMEFGEMLRSQKTFGI